MGHTRKSTIARCAHIDRSATDGETTRCVEGLRWSLRTSGERGMIHVSLTRWMQEGGGFESCVLFRDIRTLLRLHVPRVTERLVDEVHRQWFELALQAGEQAGFAPGLDSSGVRVLTWPEDEAAIVVEHPDRLTARLVLSGVLGTYPAPERLPAIEKAPLVAAL